MKSPENWDFESYELTLDKDEHTFGAIVWNYGELSPMNRLSLKPGFILIPQNEDHLNILGTGVADWRVKQLTHHQFQKLKIVPGGWMSVAPHETIDFSMEEQGGDWRKPIMTGQGLNGSLLKTNSNHCLVPSKIKSIDAAAVFPVKAVFVSDIVDYCEALPETIKNRVDIDSIDIGINEIPLMFPPNSTKRVIFELDNYYCAFTRLKVDGGKGAEIRVTWAEAAFTDPEKPQKSDRHTILGKYFRGIWDSAILDGSKREWTPLSWRCGRFIELLIKTADEPLELKEFTLEEKRYPLEMDAAFSSDQKSIDAIVKLCFRTLQMSAHDEFVDCPFYEQLLYAGDGRLEALTSLVSCQDDTLPRKAISTFASSRDVNGNIMARWPSRYRQYIPSFSLWWIGMLYDYALWRDDKNFVASHIPAMRNLLDNFMLNMDDEGFLRGAHWQWNFIDWVDEWKTEYHAGVPPGIEQSVNATYNWLFVYVLRLAEKLEHYVGSTFHGQLWGENAQKLSKKLKNRFWTPEKGLFTEDDTRKHFSKHAQILAILSETLDVEQIERIPKSLFSDASLPPCSLFYTHYLFETAASLKMPDQILNGLSIWNDFIEKGFKTTPETPENRTFNQRSDCHGWGAHPIYHLIANIAGIKPAEMEFKTVVIQPQMGKLQKINAKCTHPKGLISVVLEKSDDRLNAKIMLPADVKGVFIYKEKPYNISGESNDIEL